MNIQLNPLQIFSANNNKKFKQPKFNSNFIYRTNLSMPATDTVSFGVGVKEMKDLTKPISIKVIKDTRAEVLDSFSFFKNNLKEFLEPITINPDNSNTYQRIIHNFKARLKGEDSILEKAKANDFRTKKDIKKMGDIGGARIALARSDNRSTGKLFDYLIRFFKKYHDHFELVQIENYRLKDWSYASSSSLDRLSRISTHPNQQLVEKYHPVGYPAIHLEVYDKIADATYEIQIMGQDVEKFKEIEDIKYKVIGCKKHITRTNKKAFLKECAKKLSILGIKNPLKTSKNQNNNLALEHLEKRYQKYDELIQETENKLIKAFKILKEKGLIKVFNQYTKDMYWNQIKISAKVPYRKDLPESGIKYAQFPEELKIKNIPELKNIFSSEDENLLNFEVLNFVRIKINKLLVPTVSE